MVSLASYLLDVMDVCNVDWIVIIKEKSRKDVFSLISFCVVSVVIVNDTYIIKVCISIDRQVEYNVSIKMFVEIM